MNLAQIASLFHISLHLFLTSVESARLCIEEVRTVSENDLLEMGKPLQEPPFQELCCYSSQSLKSICSYVFLEMVKWASPKLCWDERCWDETVVDGNALTFLVYPQTKTAELGNEEPAAYWTERLSVVRWYGRVYATCLQSVSGSNSVSSLPGLSEKWKLNSLQVADLNVCMRFRASCGSKCRKIIRNLWLPVHEIRSISCCSFATSKKRTTLKIILFYVRITL